MATMRVCVRTNGVDVFMGESSRDFPESRSADGAEPIKVEIDFSGLQRLYRVLSRLILSLFGRPAREFFVAP